LIKIIGTLPGGEFSDPSSEEVDLLVPISTGDRPKLFKEVNIFCFFGYYGKLIFSLNLLYSKKNLKYK